MAEEKKGGRFGEVLGCLILIIAVIAVLFWFLLKPKLEEAGYSFTGLSEKASDLGKGVSGALRETVDKYKDTREKAAAKAEETQDIAADVVK